MADEIKMSRPFSLLEEEATLSIVRTADVLFQRSAELFKPFDISPAQYNVLRILRGAKTQNSGDKSLSCGQIAERMVNRDPDVTRLLDRMEARGLISRARDCQDRRVVKTAIAPKGSRLLEELDPLIAAHHRRQFAGFAEKKLQQLVEWMEQIRETG